MFRAKGMLALALAAAALTAGAAGPSRVAKIAALPEEERLWLTELVAPIILPEEEKLFLDLSRPDQFAHFKEDFWTRRERDGLPYPMGPGYRRRYEELRALADSRYDGWREDAGRMVVRFGEPNGIDTLEGEKLTFRDLEIWTYSHSAQGSGLVRHFFYRKSPGAPRRLWTLGTSPSDVFQPGSCRRTFDEMLEDCKPPDVRDRDKCVKSNELCRVYQIYTEIAHRQGSPNGAFAEWGRLLAAEGLSTEGLELLRTRLLGPADSSPGAKTLSATGPSGSAPPPPSPTPRAARVSRGDKLKALPEDERTWLDFVSPIIQPEEEKVFLDLTEAHQFERFHREFWARRSAEGMPSPFGSGYEARYQELHRLAEEVYDGVRSDAGRLVLWAGEPKEVEKIRGCEHVFRDVEIWRYGNGVKGIPLFLFYRFDELQPRRLYDVNSPDRELFAGDSCRQRVADLRMDCPGSFNPNDRCKGPVCGDACTVYQAIVSIRGRQMNGIGAERERGLVLSGPVVVTEGLEKVRDLSATASDPGAKPLAVTGPSGSVAPPASPAKPLSAARKKELVDALPIAERSWLTDFVAPIIQPEEEDLFLQLSKPEQFSLFKAEFWKRREKDDLLYPMGPGYRGRYEELRRKADQEFDGWRNDAGRMVIRWGEPASISRLEACVDTGTFKDLEVWTYRQGGQGSGQWRHIFYRSNLGAPRRLWTVGTPDSDVFQSGSCRKTFASLSKDCVLDPNDVCARAHCGDLCTVFQIWSEIRMRQGSLASAGIERGGLLEAPKVATEDLSGLRERLLAPAATTAAVPPPALAPVQKAAPKKVAKVSRKEAIADLPEADRVWLTDYVAPIIVPDEEKLFLELTEEYQRLMFKKAFWARRERDGLAAPFGPGFERRYEELRPKLDSVYDGWRQDAARVVLRNGEPHEIHVPEGCDTVFRDLEIWTYVNLTWARQVVYHIFYRPTPVSPRVLWRASNAPTMTLGSVDAWKDREVFQPGSCRQSFESLEKDCSLTPTDKCAAPVCMGACDVYRVYRTILTIQGSAIGGMIESARITTLPEVSTEGLDQLRKDMAAVSNPNAKPINAVGPSSTPRKPPEPTPTPEPRHALSEDEIRDRIVQLEPKYRQWLELAGPLLTLDDLSSFLQMTSAEKDKYMKNFFKKQK